MRSEKEKKQQPLVIEDDKNSNGRKIACPNCKERYIRWDCWYTKVCKGCEFCDGIKSVTLLCSRGNSQSQWCRERRLAAIVSLLVLSIETYLNLTAPMLLLAVYIRTHVLHYSHPLHTTNSYQYTLLYTTTTLYYY